MMRLQRALCSIRFRAILVLAFPLSLIQPPSSFAQTTLDTNAIRAVNTPTWLTTARLNRVVDRIQSKLEWDIRKIEAHWYTDSNEFKKLHGFDDSVLAFTRGTDASVHVGPRVDSGNFDAVFGHELVHVILRQKYRGAIPRWLEEGLANFFSKHGKVDYIWLDAQPARDVYSLSHPFKPDARNVTGGENGSARYHYQAATALMELLAAKCGGADDLIRMSVGKKLENYLPTLCGIQDLNREFRTWVKRKASSASKT